MATEHHQPSVPIGPEVAEMPVHAAKGHRVDRRCLVPPRNAARTRIEQERLPIGNVYIAPVGRFGVDPKIKRFSKLYQAALRFATCTRQRMSASASVSSFTTDRSAA